jgi:hypothetical protein
VPIPNRVAPDPQRDADAAETHRKARCFIFGSTRPRPPALFATTEAGATVSKAIAGTFRDSCSALRTGHRSLEGHIEIFRRVRSEADRPVVDQAFRMNEAILECEAVDKRLQRRTR